MSEHLTKKGKMKPKKSFFGKGKKSAGKKKFSLFKKKMDTDMDDM